MWYGGQVRDISGQIRLARKQVIKLEKNFEKYISKTTIGQIRSKN
jgi:hypothetical protein